MNNLNLYDIGQGFGDGLVELATENPNIVVLCADLSYSLRLIEYKEKFPQRFIQVGVAEANMMGIAAGLAISGKIPFTASFAVFSTGRVYDQIRQCIAYSNTNVKICASHIGFSLGMDGGTHQMLEDIGLMKMLPNMTIVSTTDYFQTKAATKAIANYNGPVYLRFSKGKLKSYFSEDMSFEIGKALLLQQGCDITIFFTGYVIWIVIDAVRYLKSIGIKVELINIHTIKPLDSELILKSTLKTQKALIVDEHQINGGLGESIINLLIRHNPIPVRVIGVNDKFGKTGTHEQLLHHFDISSEKIIKEAKDLLNHEV